MEYQLVLEQSPSAIQPFLYLSRVTLIIVLVYIPSLLFLPFGLSFSRSTSCRHPFQGDSLQDNLILHLSTWDNLSLAQTKHVDMCGIFVCMLLCVDESEKKKKGKDKRNLTSQEHDF